ncbi:hypothetical protein CYMTET_39650 [Cymbomonas tetramitiformis]|uniref:Transposase n=1 Tax=Cymbomonas tetramitiformis TaxID=36881 RepID=A0AAE0CAV4_9CHLO|nr:hypothetical protein CYMTET_39653 [Cymbomonas tetramitiformis]KAK3250999.1 hypothetical protein CYMTET_39650 [Cymbomonas tetramitiformis]
MLLTAVAKPDIAHNFDGKIWIYRCTEIKTALRNSKNYAKGENYEIDTSMTAEKYVEIMYRILGDIKRKLWWAKRGQIKVQCDNASPHASAQKQVAEYAKKLGIILSHQPAQSPDTNINDLGVYSSMQARVDALCARLRVNAESVFEASMQAWSELLPSRIHILFEIKRVALQCIIKFARGNGFRIPHVLGVRKELAPYIHNSVNKYFEEAEETDESEDEDGTECRVDDDGGSCSYKQPAADQQRLVSTSWQAKPQRGNHGKSVALAIYEEDSSDGDHRRKQRKTKHGTDTAKGKAKLVAHTADNVEEMPAPTNAVRDKQVKQRTQKPGAKQPVLRLRPSVLKLRPPVLRLRK